METPKRISVRELMKIEGFDSVEEMVEEYINAGVAPPCCSCCADGCIVEPDGECPHGHPSFLIVLGLL